MSTAEILSIDGYLIVSMHSYPCTLLADAICKLSDDGKAFIVPTGTNPELPWIWRYHSKVETAITILLKKHNFTVRIMNEYEQARLGRILS